MSSAASKAASELRVFERFAKAACLRIVPTSVENRQPPEPDILCELQPHGLTAFELLEVVDPELMTQDWFKIQAQEMLRSKSNGPGGLAAFSDASIALTFVKKTSKVQREMVTTPLFHCLRELPSGFEGGVPLPEWVRKVVSDVRVTRGGFVGPLFDVRAGGFVVDPIAESIESKFTKRYKTRARRIELLAYYESQPSQRAHFNFPKVEAFVLKALPAAPFSRVWVFDVGRNAVLAVWPSS